MTFIVKNHSLIGYRINLSNKNTIFKNSNNHKIQLQPVADSSIQRTGKKQPKLSEINHRNMKQKKFLERVAAKEESQCSLVAGRKYENSIHISTVLRNPNRYATVI